MRPQVFIKPKGLFQSTRTLTNSRHFSQTQRSRLISFPWIQSNPNSHVRFYSSGATPHNPGKEPPPHQFFKAIADYKKTDSLSSILEMLHHKPKLQRLLEQLNAYPEENYLQEQFIHWLNAYAIDSSGYVKGYLSGQHDLTALCQDFIHFCFKKGISLEADKTLYSFKYHNQLCDTAVKQKLLSMKPKEQVNLLGFGLDEGGYEKSLAQFLITQRKAQTVRIYGFDPYASKTPGIEYLTPLQLDAINTPAFDVVVARWVLHHVELHHRWEHFIRCINRCQPGALVLIVEHGFLKDHCAMLDKKLYYLFNAIFDIVANIGLRPRYLTSTTPDIGSHFFIRYLEPRDFHQISDHISLQLTQQCYDIGPAFPNQTIYTMRFPG